MRKVMRAWDGNTILDEVIPILGQKLIMQIHSLVGNKLHRVEAFLFPSGLFSQDGEEIYEGDIVRNGTEDNLVVFERGCFMIYRPRNKSAPLYHTARFSEIIGNKYEDPKMHYEGK